MWLYQVTTYATAKERKKIVKSLKDHVADCFMHECGYLLVCAIFSTVDDTTLVKKAVLGEAIKQLPELVDHKHASKPLLFLLNPAATRYFPAEVQELLQPGSRPLRLMSGKGKEEEEEEEDVEDEEANGQSGQELVCTSKKDPELRRKELLGGDGLVSLHCTSNEFSIHAMADCI